MKNIKSNKAITLIALVITIVVLLILATVVIRIGLGENGIFSKAKLARQEYLNAQAAEQEAINGIDWKLANGNSISEVNDNLPENTASTKAGTPVKIPTEWTTEAVSEFRNANGVKVASTTKVATVYAVSDGSGNTIPIPEKFYYVGGNIEKGIVISDNQNDKDKYANDENMDVGIDLEGNQFVWIPCNYSNYHKSNWSSNGTSQGNQTNRSDCYWDTTTPSAEKAQIEKYGGFYVGRYEAGAGTITGINFAAAYSTSDWTKADFKYANVTGGNVSSKANEIPYYHADYYTAVEMSERMYKNDSVRKDYVDSGLITGTMWDVMLNTINAKTSASLTSSDWGNYNNNTVTTGFRGKYSTVNASNGSNSAWADNTAGTDGNSGTLLSTGSNDNFQKYHIFDVAGNLWEWTAENTHVPSDTATESRSVLRGGSFTAALASYPACFRANVVASDAGTYSGFRVALFIK